MDKLARLKKLLLILLNTNEYVPSSYLAEELSVSQRTIFNYLDSSQFKSMLNGAKVERRENQGIKLHANEKQKKQISFMFYEKELVDIETKNSFSDLENLLLFFLPRNHATKNEIADFLFVNIGSLGNIIKEANEYIQSTSVQLAAKMGNGIMLLGDEKNIRKMFQQVIMDALRKKDPVGHTLSIDRISDTTRHYLELIFSKDTLNKMIDVISISEVNLNEIYTNFDFELLLVKQCIRIKRISNNYFVKTNASFSSSVREYLISQLMSFKIREFFNITISSDELYDLTEDVLATRRINYNSFNAEINNNEIKSDFINLISAGLGIDLTHDIDLANNLTKHLLPAIRRMKYGLKIENPLLKQIKFEYTREYIVVMTCIEEIEKQYNIRFDQNELGYICLHVVAAINRHTKERSINTLLICDDGLTIYSYLISKIHHQFSDISINETISSQEARSFDFEKYDLILNSTDFFFKPHEKVVSISMILTDIDLENIRTWITNKEYEELMSVEHDLHRAFFFFKDSITDREKLITQYSKFLEIDGYVTDKFAKSAIEREKATSTLLGRGIALPHGSSDFVMKSATLIIQLEKPIQWDDQLVDLVFLMAIDKSDVMEFRYLMEKIYNVISDEQKLKILKTSTNRKEIESLIFSDSINT